MSMLFDRLRSGADRAAFEADKVRRVTVLQAQERKLKGEAEQSLYQVGVVAYNLYRQERISEPELLQVCDRTASLQEQVVQIGHEIERVRNESYTSTPSYTSIRGQAITCPNGHGALPEGARFCPVCGQEGVAPASPGSAFCPECGASLSVAGARFCPECGSALDEASAPPSTPQLSPPVPSQEGPLSGEKRSPRPVHQWDNDSPSSHLEPAQSPGPSLATSDGEVMVSEVVSVTQHRQVEDGVVDKRSTVKNCSGCGAPMPSDALFCPECGSRISSEEGTDSAMPEEADGWHL